MNIPEKQRQAAKTANKSSRYHNRIIATMIGTFVLVLIFAFIFLPRSSTKKTQSLPLPQQHAQRQTFNQNVNTLKRIGVTIKAQDTLSTIFRKQHLTQHQLAQILSDQKTKKMLASLKAGQKINFIMDDNKNLLQMIYKPDIMTSLIITRKDDTFSSRIEKTPTENRETYQHGVIKASLFSAGLKANVPTKLIMQLIDIFQWDIDFAKNIRPGDDFNIIYEEKYVNGEPIATGNILAAEFNNRGKLYQAIRFTDPNGHTDYYALGGTTVRKRFTRTPVKFTRISSYFKPKRWHPILHRFRKHTGIDYAAPAGTPIKATGSGKIAFIGRKGGYGNAIIIDHGNKVTTLYGHMLRFAKHERRGTKVKQGQVIGYVGMSGLATGYHVHYEFRINNKYRDPLKVKLPTGHSVPKQYLVAFKVKRNHLLNRMTMYKQSALAANNTSSDTRTS